MSGNRKAYFGYFLKRFTAFHRQASENHDDSLNVEFYSIRVDYAFLKMKPCVAWVRAKKVKGEGWV